MYSTCTLTCICHRSSCRFSICMSFSSTSASLFLNALIIAIFNLAISAFICCLPTQSGASLPQTAAVAPQLKAVGLECCADTGRPRVLLSQLLMEWLDVVPPTFYLRASQEASWIVRVWVSVGEEGAWKHLMEVHDQSRVYTFPRPVQVCMCPIRV